MPYSNTQEFIGALGASVESAEITDGTIVNADINASAAIALSKLASTGDLGSAVTIGAAQIVTPASTSTFTNKTFDANGTGNSITNINTADIVDATAVPAASKIAVSDASGLLDGWISAATDALAGKVELAIASEVTTGTATDRAITPDALAGSTIFGVKSVQFVVFDFATNCAIGDGKFYFHVPASLNGMNIVGVHAEVITAGTTNTMDIQIANVTQAVDVLSTVLTIDSEETGSDTAATPAVINAANDALTTNDVIRIDVDAVHTTPAAGLIITIDCQLP